MKKTIIATYPRSGHHFLAERILIPIIEDEIKYCEVYSHCGSVPCIDSATNLQKTHDFQLKDPIKKSFKYLVQYRHPYESVVSYFLLETVNNNIEDSLPSWHMFLREKTEYWKRFMQKWAFLSQEEGISACNIQYDELVKCTQGTVKRVLDFLEVENIDHQMLQAVKPRKLSKTCDFKYFNEMDVGFVEKECEYIIKKLGILKTTI